MDGIESPEGVVVVATTNDLSAIEPALKDRPSRFDLVVEVPPLDMAMGTLYIRDWMTRRGISMPEGCGDLLSRHRVTGAEVQEICLAASLRAMERSPAELVVTAEDFQHAEQRLRAERQPRIGFGEVSR
jgi:SpoVK/Ycf46/Vps4 family AAA+-type ATPase